VHIDFTLKSGFSIDEEVSVGTRARPRSLLESTVPVDILSNRNLNSTPQIELGQILHYSSATFNSVHQTISDGTDHIDPATLRGLGPDQVLVLINGKRRHTSSMLNINGTVGRGSVGTDFNAIPFGAVDRIEILRDGAAAQYGSDAIAGVVNIILKEQTGITHVDGYVGQNTAGDGLQTFYNGNVGFDIGDGGFIKLTLEFRVREATNRSGAYTGNVYLNNNDALDETLIATRDFFGQTGYDGRRVMEIGNAATRNLSFFFNAEIPISSTLSFYGHGGRNFRRGEAAGFYRFPKDSTRVVHEVYPDGFSPRIGTEIQDDAVTIGIRGMRNNWNVDFSNTSGSNQLDFNVFNSNNASFGPRSPRSFYSGGYFYSQNTTNFDAHRAFDWLSGVNVAFGVDMRIENFQILSGDEESYAQGSADTLMIDGQVRINESGAQVFPGFQPDNEVNEFRTNNAWYIDIESKLTPKLILGTAGRYESYSDFGDQATWKLSSRYKFSDKFSINIKHDNGFFIVEGGHAIGRIISKELGAGAVKI
jgi:iron complex outermembrane receptor protein